VESQKLEVFQRYVPALQEALPLPADDRPSKHGHRTPMQVMDAPFRAGDLRHGYQAVANNLPNDPRIHQEKGTKKTFFKNFMDARVTYVILPIARRLLPAVLLAGPMFLVLAFFGFTGYHLFLNLGVEDPNVTAGTAALIIASAPAFIAVLAVLLLRERIGPVPAGGIALAFGGLGVMIFLAQPGSEYTFRVSTGALAVLPPAVFAALYAVLGKGYLRRYPPFSFVAWTLFLGTLLTLPLVLLSYEGFLADLATMGGAGAAPVLYLGIFPTFLAYGIWFRGLERMPAAAAGAYVYLSTLVAILGGIAILGETITGAGILGGAMVIAGVVLAQRRSTREVPDGA